MAKRISPQQARERFEHHVGADERAVEVNGERNVLVSATRHAGGLSWPLARLLLRCRG